jgi:hypothetical protein
MPSCALRQWKRHLSFSPSASIVSWCGGGVHRYSDRVLGRKRSASVRHDFRLSADRRTVPNRHGLLDPLVRAPAFPCHAGGYVPVRGMGFVVNPQSLGIEHPFFLQHITEDLSIHLTERVSLPFTAICYVVIFVAALFVAHYTRFGRYIDALGGDEQSATLMGLPRGAHQDFYPRQFT